MADTQVNHTLTWNELKALSSTTGYEVAGFMVGTRVTITDVWVVPSLKSSSSSYSIGRDAWDAARAKARLLGLRIWGSVHSHPNGPLGPSEKDLRLAARCKHPVTRAIWNPRHGTLTFYGNTGALEPETVQRPLHSRLAAPLFFAKN